MSLDLMIVVKSIKYVVNGIGQSQMFDIFNIKYF